MKRCLLFLLLGMALVDARAVEVIINGAGSYNTTAPASADIANWDTGWGAPGITGWDYVGRIGDAGGVYLGNGWVLTAGHVGAGTFTLDGTSYAAVAGSAQGFENSTGTADLTLFQLIQGPDLPPLALETTAPAALSSGNPGDQTAMIGYGGGALSWGLDTVTEADMSIVVTGYPYDSIDFETAYGTTTVENNTTTNYASLVSGDSGGGNFIYNSSTGTWMLAGINEAIDENADSYMVQVSAYASQIKGVASVPEPGSFILAGVALAALAALAAFRRNLRLHRRLLQHPPQTLVPRLQNPEPVRGPNPLNKLRHKRSKNQLHLISAIKKYCTPGTPQGD